MPDTVLSSTKIIKTSDGQTIFAEASGDPNKPHVVFIHGLSLSGAVFNEFCARADVLRELYVVRYDLRGHGRSCMPMTPEGHASSLYADDFKAVVEAFHLRKPILMGWSMGGIISSDIAAHLPHDILSGIFYLSASFHASLITGPAATQELGSVFIRHREPAAIPGAMIDFIDACLGSSAVSKPSYDLRCRYAGMGALQLPQMRALIVTRQQELEPIHKLLGSGIPVFHMYGTDDRLVQGSAMEEEHRKLVKSLEVVVVPGAGHTLFWELPDMVASRLIEFARSTASKVEALSQPHFFDGAATYLDYWG